MIGARPLSLPRVQAGEADQASAPRITRASRTRRASGAGVAFFTALVLLTVTCGWLFHDRLPLTPKSGIGYGLGVAGGVTILILSMFPARKRLRFMRSWGAASRWFRIHMILGILGPLLILFHCNFHFGAPNSNVALVSMLVVATSGVVGRYIYMHISHGLYGARATREELHAQLNVRAHTLDERLPPASSAARRLAAFAARAQAPHRVIGGRLFRLVALPLRARWVHRRVLHDIHADLKGEAAQVGSDAYARAAATRELIGAYIAALVKEMQFSTYERLFSLWHALHIPLFVMLLLSGVLHVISVHKY